MPRAARLQVGPSRYSRKQGAARYMHSGKIKPCRVCGMVEREGCVLWGMVKQTPRTRFVWEAGQRRIEMETKPDGEVVPLEYVAVETQNYHSECEAEEEKRRRSLKPRKRDMLQARVDALEAELAELKASGRVAGRVARGSSQAQDTSELKKASQVAPGHVGSGVGERVRVKKDPVVRRDGWDWLRESEAELPHHLRHNLNRPVAELDRAGAEDLLAMLGQPVVDGTPTKSEADPDS